MTSYLKQLYMYYCSSAASVDWLSFLFTHALELECYLLHALSNLEYTAQYANLWLANVVVNF